MEDDEKKMEEMFKKGVEYLETGKIKDAIEVFEEVIKGDNKDASAHFNLGLACMRMARRDIDKEELYEEKTDEESWLLRAISEFKKVLELEPENEEAKENIDVLNKLLGMGI